MVQQDLDKDYLYSVKNIINVLNSFLNHTRLDDFETDTYTYSYNKIIKHFEKLRTDNDYKNWLVIGSSIVYSWMPTILNFGGRESRNVKNKKDKIDFEQLIKDIDLKKIEKGKELEPLLKFINNSVVGMSKFLHFSFPENFPIWDSRVEFALFNDKNKKTKNNFHRLNLKNYNKYRQSCINIIQNNEDIFDKINEKIPTLNGLTKMRQIEFILFQRGGTS
jgi:hypothetical protein